jgi:hypothetical protein
MRDFAGSDAKFNVVAQGPVESGSTRGDLV